MNCHNRSNIAILLASFAGVCAAALADPLLVHLNASATSALSRDGTTLVNSALPTPSGGWSGFPDPPVWFSMWSVQNGFTLCPTPFAQAWSPPGGVSADGSVIVGSIKAIYSYGPQGAFSWNQSSPTISMSPFTTDFSYGLAVNGNGTAFVFTNFTGQHGTYVWDGTQMIRLSAYGAYVASISDDAHSVAFYSSYDFNLSLWTLARGVQTLALPSGSWPSNTQIVLSPDGRTLHATGASAGTCTLFRWTFDELGNATRTELCTVPHGANDSDVAGVSADGTLVAFNADQPYIWSAAGGPRPLTEYLSEQGVAWGESSMARVAGMSASGRQFAGSEYSGNSYPTAWYLNLSPEDFGFCPADFNRDRQVDDADFVAFAKAYDEFECFESPMGPPRHCPWDLNWNGYIDDDDFILFAAAYDEYLCD